MVQDGKLDKYGRPNENTPREWKQNYIDYTPAKQGESLTTPVTAGGRVTPRVELGKRKRSDGGEGGITKEGTTTTAAAEAAGSTQLITEIKKEKTKKKKRKKSVEGTDAGTTALVKPEPEGDAAQTTVDVPPAQKEKKKKKKKKSSSS